MAKSRARSWRFSRMSRRYIRNPLEMSRSGSARTRVYVTFRNRLQSRRNQWVLDSPPGTYREAIRTSASFRCFQRSSMKVGRWDRSASMVTTYGALLAWIPSMRAAPYPGSRCWITRAPRRAAASAVPSWEPPSATMISQRTPRPSSVSRSAGRSSSRFSRSFQAGITTASSDCPASCLTASPATRHKGMGLWALSRSSSGGGFLRPRPRAFQLGDLTFRDLPDPVAGGGLPHGPPELQGRLPLARRGIEAGDEAGHVRWTSREAVRDLEPVQGLSVVFEVQVIGPCQVVGNLPACGVGPDALLQEGNGPGNVACGVAQEQGAQGVGVHKVGIQGDDGLHQPLELGKPAIARQVTADVLDREQPDRVGCRAVEPEGSNSQRRRRGQEQGPVFQTRTSQRRCLLLQGYHGAEEEANGECQGDEGNPAGMEEVAGRHLMSLHSKIPMAASSRTRM